MHLSTPSCLGQERGLRGNACMHWVHVPLEGLRWPRLACRSRRPQWSQALQLADPRCAPTLPCRLYLMCAHPST